MASYALLVFSLKHWKTRSLSWKVKKKREILCWFYGIEEWGGWQGRSDV